MKIRNLEFVGLTALSVLLPAAVAFAAEPEAPVIPVRATPTVATPVASAPTLPTEPINTEAARKSVIPLETGTVSFCGQDQMLRIFLNTEIGKRLQLEQQEKYKQLSIAYEARLKAQLEEKQVREAQKPKTQDAPDTTKEVVRTAQ